MTAWSSTTDGAAAVVRDYLNDAGQPWDEPAPGVFSVELPGERKLTTSCSMAVREHSLVVNAFVARCPDENHAGVHRWLLERNARLSGVAFSVDSSGDIYLVGRLPLHAVTDPEIDRMLGVVLEAADSSFNTILELGFATSIRREWRWRLSRGESTRNLAAFEHLRPGDDG
ncbi:putative sensory transduction regulator [Haloactinopolyspora alba]|uniref:Putative sensory transduction regulator n=1 Tax=Haloactinopolyspora alba TaxID=648780 RepID=A0A2P8DZ27_9ACTN|nr:YbjN domain-containing protein [Haloactinopolyspora alba]PSL02475.1 putative sensory transduction regulator [Haloactinopolyspora alba]